MMVLINLEDFLYIMEMFLFVASPSIQSVVINIEDQNDNPPKFKQKLFSGGKCCLFNIWLINIFNNFNLKLFLLCRLVEMVDQPLAVTPVFSVVTISINSIDCFFRVSTN